ncbi:NrfD/PsrC family molybdoenzyme membrane anchor subunit [Adlercreutzia sp. ZJ242]|uniref:NrfD/PsrC family molybdoenzyme membrane anchor subunit n=1 Tax=Adlercreutzia sp. ZJ242 TaxID=2709409 RepID=UPI0013EA9FD6|nr:NrfD/PsrC family molybdoenzyme membrane anchor subunit [Adlercreutzia sp. ZJ242]
MFSSLVTCYLFLGGTGAGACFIASMLAKLSPRGLRESAGEARSYQRLLAPSFAAAFALLALGVLCLMVDLGRADRLLLLVTSPTLVHITVGAYALLFTLALSAALALLWRRARLGASARALRSALEAVSLVTAGVTMAYTGLLLQAQAAVPLWASPWLPVLFVLSSLSCGAAATLVTAQFTGAARTFSRVFARMASVDAVLILLEAAVLTALLATASRGGVLDGQSALAAQTSAEMLTGGALSEVFWGVLVAAGLVAPFVLDVVVALSRPPWPARYSAADALRVQLPGISLVAAACVLAGGAALRFCMVEAGIHPIVSTLGVM